MEMNFCRRCGSKLTKTGEGAFICDNSHRLYSNAAPATGIFFVTDDGQVLLAVRGIEPYKGMLDAIGGFVDINESLEEAIAREVQEEIGLGPDQYETPQFLCSSPSPYPYDGEERTILGSLFWSQLKPGARPVPADDVAEIKYFPLKDVDLSLIGNTDIRIGLEKIQMLQKLKKILAE